MYTEQCHVLLMQGGDVSIASLVKLVILDEVGVDFFKLWLMFLCPWVRLCLKAAAILN